MGTAIVIHLDYENQPTVQCRNLWAVIEARMLAAGFEKSGRRFLSDLDSHSAGQLAQSVMDAIDREYTRRGQSAMACLNDFYAVPRAKIVDLLAPVSHAIEVDMMSTGAFQTFFGRL
jgi:hypothetical protein